jgi:hypothetical protein
MAKARSPSYPAIGLREAIERVMLVYQKDYQNPIPRAVAVEHMGYSGLSGKSMGVLAALSKYGLLEGRGDNTRVTDLAVTIIAHPQGTPERAIAIQQAASLPELFADIETRFSGKASDQAIRSYLLTEKYIPGAAEIALRAYRETMQLVEEEKRAYDPEKVQQSRDLMAGLESTTQEISRASLIPSSKVSQYSGTTEIENIRVSKDCAIRLIADGPYTKRSIEALVKNLQLQLELGTYDDITAPEVPTKPPSA